MRITNTMMSNSMLSRINKNMVSLDKYYTQFSSGKKIQMPSEDPITSSRALKLRNIVSSTTQYTSNANQGTAWMETTESAYKNITSIFDTLSELCIQGASDQYKEDDRKKILNDFNSLVGQIESEMNSTYMGRYIFSGYKTNTPPIIKDDKTGKNILNTEIYGETPTIEESLDFVNEEVVKKVNDITEKIANLNGQINTATGDTSALESERDSLIKDLKKAVSSDNLEFYVSDDKQTIRLQSKDPDSSSGGSGSGSSGTGTSFIVAELVNGDKANPLSAKENSKGGIDFYVDGTKVNLDIPEQKLPGDRIKLEVGTNNYIEINSLAVESYTTEMYNTLHYFEKVYDYMDGTLSKEDTETYFGGKLFEDLEEKEVVSFDSKLRADFDSMISKINNFNSSVTEQHTNLGVRMNRINLIQDRLDDDYVNYSTLMSKNEDVNYAEVAMNFNTANATYQAALKTGMTITQLTLADFL